MVYYDKEYIANIIQKTRKQRGLKQSQLAEKVGISEKHLSKIETGRNYPALDNFLKMIEVLGLSFNDFGFDTVNEVSINRQKLQKIINTATDEQISVYLDVLTSLQKYF